jgi:hypothetical protein
MTLPEIRENARIFFVFRFQKRRIPHIISCKHQKSGPFPACGDKKYCSLPPALNPMFYQNLIQTGYSALRTSSVLIFISTFVSG